jgi:hypothetical protein
MTKRRQLIEEAGRLRRLWQACRVDIAWACLTTKASRIELERRAAEADELLERAVELERAATGLPLGADPAGQQARDEVRRQRDEVALRAATLRQKRDACRKLVADEKAIGGQHRIEFLERVADQIEAKVRWLDVEAERLGKQLAALPDPEREARRFALTLISGA